MSSFLDRERITAPPGFNRWLVPPAALAIHLCIGEAYAFGIWFMPAIALSLPFIIMAAVLIVRPWGLLGRSGGGEL